MRKISIKTKLVIGLLFVSIIPILIFAFYTIKANDELYIENCNIQAEYNFYKYFSDNGYAEIAGEAIFIDDNVDGTVKNEILSKIEISDEKNYKIRSEDGLDTYCITIKNLNDQIYINVLISENNVSYLVLFKVMFYILILSVCISFGITNYIVSDIDKLSIRINQVNDGNYKCKKMKLSNIEIAELYESFESMISKIDFLVNNQLRLEIAEKEAQFKSMQAQISPHFLYNALENLNCTLLVKEEYEMSEMVCNVSEILRYSISDYKRLVKISTELTYLEYYLKVQKVRFEEKFDYKIDIADDVKNCYIPKLLVQPILENAFKHGIGDCGEQNIISVKASRYDDGIQIVVADDGAGIENSKLLEINNILHGTISSNSIGLKNVNDRIKLIYGSKYGLTVESEDNSGCVIKINIGIREEINEFTNYRK